MSWHEYKCKLGIHDYTETVTQEGDIKVLTKKCMWCGETKLVPLEW